MIKFLRTIFVLSLVFSQLTGLALAAPEQPSPTKELLKNVTEGTANSVIFDNLTKLVGPTCSLYGLSFEILNSVYDDETFGGSGIGQIIPMPIQGIAEISVLFHSEPWRNLIWALDDRRTALLEQRAQLQKQKCYFNAAVGGYQVKGLDYEKKVMDERLQATNQQLTELQAKLDFFKIERQKLLLSSVTPKFYEVFLDWNKVKIDDRTNAFADFSRASQNAIPLDKIFYWLPSFNTFENNLQQFAKETERFVNNVDPAVRAALDTIPDACFASMDILNQLRLHFDYVKGKTNELRNIEKPEYKDFQDFVEKNKTDIKKVYIEGVCKAAQKRAAAKGVKSTDAETQYADFLAALQKTIAVLGNNLVRIEHELAVLRQKKRANVSLYADQAKAVNERIPVLQKERGETLARIDYYTMVITALGSPGETSLSKLSKSLSNLVETILNVKKDENGKVISRLNLSDRFQKAKERSLQQICSRIEDMYRKSGRDLGLLPIIGVANGKTYCRVDATCESVDNPTIPGISEGGKRLADCTTLKFQNGQLGPSAVDSRSMIQAGQDIAFMLSQQSYQDLEQQKNLYFQSLRARYLTMAQNQHDLTGVIGQILDGATKSLNFKGKEENFDPKNETTQRNQYTLEGKIYTDFYSFVESQERLSCSASKEPD